MPSGTRSPEAGEARERSASLGMLLLFFAVALSALLVYAVGQIERQHATDELRMATRHRLDVFMLSLRNAIDRYSYLPFTVAKHSDVQRLLQEPGDQELLERVNDYLETIAVASGAAAAYVMDETGLTIASSNAEKVVARNFAYRPYFQEALSGQRAHFYGVSAITGHAGHFISQPVHGEDRVIGVITVMLNLDVLELNWREGADKVLLFDRHGVAFLSSRPEWKLRIRNTPDPATLSYLRQTRKYGRESFDVLPLRPAGEGFVRERGVAHYLMEERALPELGWRMQLLASTAPIEEAVVLSRIATAALLGMLFAGVFAVRQRRRRDVERRAAQAELERKVVERTAELSAANTALEAEIAERRRAERELRGAQEELVQAAKLAVLGQMAAGITHEINQPLSALDATAAAAQSFVAKGRFDKLEPGLVRIRSLVERIGKITGQLRAFSRKSGGQPQEVPLGAALANAMFLIRQGGYRRSAEIVLPAVDESLRIVFDPLRLEQVLVNILRNALDATADRSDGQVQVRIRRNGDRAQLTVTDNGPGFSPEVLARLFEPFFTTKPAGEGLGLGLAVSDAIAREYDASLVAANAPGGGAVLTLNLRIAQ